MNLSRVWTQHYSFGNEFPATPDDPPTNTHTIDTAQPETRKTTTDSSSTIENQTQSPVVIFELHPPIGNTASPAEPAEPDQRLINSESGLDTPLEPVLPVNPTLSESDTSSSSSSNSDSNTASSSSSGSSSSPSDSSDTED